MIFIKRYCGLLIENQIALPHDTTRLALLSVPDDSGPCFCHDPGGLLQHGVRQCTEVCDGQIAKSHEC